MTRGPMIAFAALAMIASCGHDSRGSLATTPTSISPTTSIIGPPTTSSTVAPTTVEPTTVELPAVEPTTVEPTTVEPTTVEPTTVEPTTVDPATVAHAFPVEDAAAAGFQNDHHDYPATDIFRRCGATVVSPVDGVINQLRRFDPWVRSVDDPDTRGGIFVSIIGDDGVRYYLAHFRSIDDGLDVGSRLEAGDPIAVMGDTGRAGACHTHFALSPPCPNDEWWVRRGVIWPAEYLRQWQAGTNASPAAEITQWSNDHPDACITPPPPGS